MTVTVSLGGGGGGSDSPLKIYGGMSPPLFFLLILCEVHVAKSSTFKARTVKEPVSLGEISLIVGMIKAYVIVTIVYLNTFYREEGGMIGYTNKQLLLNSVQII